MRFHRFTAICLLAATAALVVWAAPCPALINPNFTPRHLVDQSELVLAGTLAGPDGAGDWKLSAGQAVKGKAPAEHTLSLRSCEKDYLADVERTLRANGGRTVVLFAAAKEKRAYVHVGGTWLAARPDGAGKWLLTGPAPRMSSTYAGGTDMLIRMCEHLMADPRAPMPVSAAVSWLAAVKVAQVGPDAGAMAVVEVGKGRAVHLHVACPAGDRLFRPSGREDEVTFADVAAKLHLAARSRCAVWLDVNGDGLADLVGADDAGVSVRFATAEGGFRRGGAEWLYRPQGKVAALAACGQAGNAGVLVSTYALPVHLSAGADGWRARALPSGAALEKPAGVPSPCVVADLDNDGFADVLQPAGRGGVLWRGKADGFHTPAASNVAAGEGRAVAAVGDFDADGSLDVFLSAPGGSTLWANDGKAGFREVLAQGGSLSYKCPPGATAAAAIDLNHDGWQDLCLVWRSGNLLYHFNRGFRSFGEEGEVRLEGPGGPAPQAAPGQQALAAGDFNADGSTDLAVMNTDGALWCYLNELADMPGLRLRLAPGLPGPVTAICLPGGKPGAPAPAVSVAASSPPAFLAIPRPGKVAITFRLPGGPAHTTTVIVTKGIKDVTLTAPPGP